MRYVSKFVNHHIVDGFVRVIHQSPGETKAVFAGDSDKLLLIIGPCSADKDDSVIDYITRLRKVQDKVEDKILIIPRIYTNKPRTTGEGYKGMIHQPDPSAAEDMLEGIKAEYTGAEGFPFDPETVPVKISVPVVGVEGWTLDEGRYTPALPKNVVPESDQVQYIDLVPYGSTTLRLTTFPTIKSL